MEFEVGFSQLCRFGLRRPIMTSVAFHEAMAVSPVLRSISSDGVAV